MALVSSRQRRQSPGQGHVINHVSLRNQNSKYMDCLSCRSIQLADAVDPTQQKLKVRPVQVTQRILDELTASVQGPRPVIMQEWVLKQRAATAPRRTLAGGGFMPQPLRGRRRGRFCSHQSRACTRSGVVLHIPYRNRRRFCWRGCRCRGRLVARCIPKKAVLVTTAWCLSSGASHAIKHDFASPVEHTLTNPPELLPGDNDDCFGCFLYPFCFVQHTLGAKCFCDLAEPVQREPIIPMLYNRKLGGRTMFSPSVEMNCCSS